MGALGYSAMKSNWLSHLRPHPILELSDGFDVTPEKRMRRDMVTVAGFAVAWEVKEEEEDGLQSSGGASHFAQDHGAGLKQ